MGGGLLERFEEITKLLYAKLYAEKFESAAVLLDVDHASVESIYETVSRIYQKSMQAFPEDLLRGYGVLGADQVAIAKVSRLLKPVHLSSLEADIKGLVYEELVRNTFEKTDHQQFFTPRTVVEFMVELAFAMTGEIADNDSVYVCDPACGSGGFLIDALRFTNRNSKVIGFEIDQRMAWVAQMNILMHGGELNSIYYLDQGGSLGFSPKLAEIVPDTGFDLIITNPPFGSDFSDASVLHQYKLGQGKSRRRGILFVERCIQWLKDGSGRLAMIVEDSLLNGTSSHDVRELILRGCVVEAVISLPEVTFKPYASVKTSILFLRRRKPDQPEVQTPIFMAEVEAVGRKANGDPQFCHDDQGTLVLNNQLPAVLEAWLAFQRDGEAAIHPLSPRIFICPQERFDDPLQQPRVDRLDVAYHHPSRAIAEGALRRSKYPMPELAELVVERNCSVVPDQAGPCDLWHYLGLADIAAKTGEYVITEVFGNQVKSPVKCFKGGDILFSKLRPELRKCVLIDDQEEGCVSSECFVFRPIDYGEKSFQFEVNRQYLAIMLRSDMVYGQLVHQISGTGRPRVHRSAVLAVKIPLPPLVTQREIIALHQMAQQNYWDSQRRSQAELQNGIQGLDSAFQLTAEKLCPSGHDLQADLQAD